MLATLKGLPLAYDRDLQEDKEPVFDAVETLTTVLPALTGTVATMRVRADRLEKAAPAGFSLATDVAEFLVRKGVAFRDAHEAVGHLVVWCLAHDVGLEDVSDADLAAVSPHLTPDVRAVLSVPGALAARSAPGGTAPVRVREQLAAVLRAARTRPDVGGWPLSRLSRCRRRSTTRPSLEVARDLLGCLLTDGAVTVRLVEVEAYAGPDRPGVALVPRQDPAQRDHVGAAGKAVRLLHLRDALVHERGLRRPTGNASAVLLRAGEVVAGAATSRRLAARVCASVDLGRGPARLARLLGDHRARTTAWISPPARRR